jgi:UDP-N-acetylglucosamine 4,6-dehydratase/5-epimerase
MPRLAPKISARTWGTKSAVAEQSRRGTTSLIPDTNESNNPGQGRGGMNWEEQVVLVTGGTGSFGRYFTKIMLREMKPKRLIVFSRDEVKQMEMRSQHDERTTPSIRYMIGDVRDEERLRRAMKGVTVVVHAAALKQVPTCECNPFEAVQTNIIGSKNVVEAALDAGVEKAVVISTDKAVNPVSLYGATKLAAEKLFVHANTYSGAGGTRFAAVRYGNVLGSRDSVVPLFAKQRGTGVVTITDARMTRFWITLDQGVRFVIRSLELMHGGEVFVPKIPSMKLAELAKVIAPGCEYRVTGIRSGEKVHEVLLSEDEARHAIEYDGLFVVTPEHSWWKDSPWQKCASLPQGFSYRSDTNPDYMSHERLQQILERELNMSVPAGAVN